MCFVVVYNNAGRFVPSRLCTPQGTKCLVLGLVVLVLSHWDTRERERWWVIEMTITSSFSNTGNTPTLHLPTVTVTTVTHTHWLPTVADPHHLPQVWFGFGLALLILRIARHCKMFWTSGKTSRVGTLLTI